MKISLPQILTVLVFLIAFCLSLFKIVNADFWWIISDGRYILDNREIPFVDVFRFVSIEKDYIWDNHLYLTGTIYYIIYLLGSYEALVIFKALISAATFGLFYCLLKTIDKENIYFAAILVLISIFAVRFRLVLRPDVFSFFFFVAVYFIITRLKNYGTAPIYLIPLIHLVWVNLHGGYFAGLVLLLTVIFADSFKLMLYKWFNRGMAVPQDSRQIKQLSIAAVFSCLAVLINPYGMRVLKSAYGFIFSHEGISTSVGMARVGEWQPLALHHFKGMGICFASEYGLILVLFVVSVILVLRRVDITDIVLCTGFVYASTVSIRFIPFAVFVLIPAIYRHYGHYCRDHSGKYARISGQVLLLTIAISGVGLGSAGLKVPPTFKFGVGVKEGKFPDGAATFIKKNNIQGNFFNTYGIGGYLIWRFYPERRVFMDGRVLENIGDYYKMIDSPEAWDELSKVYNFDIVILDNDRKDFVGHIFSNTEWKLVYWDDKGMVFLKNIAKHKEIIEREAYRLVMPNFFDFSYIDHYLNSPEKKAIAAKELKRNIDSTVFNSEARLALAFLYSYSGKRYYDLAFEQVKQAVIIAPDLAMARSALGWFYIQKGNKKRGLVEINKALSLDPTDQFAKELLEKIK